MQKTFYLLTFLCLNFILVSGQSERQKFIGIEFGTDFYEYSFHDLEFMRKSKASQTIQIIPGYFQKFYTGLKTEIRSKNNRAGFFTGIRFTRIYSSIGKTSSLSEINSIFYVQQSEDETSVELLRVTELNQSAYYLGVPIEARYFLFTPKKIGLYVKSSIEFNYLVNSDTEVVFYQDAMNKYENSILEQIKDPDSFYSTMFFGFGIKIGKNDKPNINVEACLPTFSLSNYSTGFVKPEYGGGIQINIQIPF